LAFPVLAIVNPIATIVKPARSAKTRSAPRGEYFGKDEPRICVLPLLRSRRNVALMTEFTGQRWHDMGGQDADPVVPEDHDFALWEKRVDALMVITSGKGLFTVDGLRRCIEDLGETAYETMSYYERWVASVNQNLLEAGTYKNAELGAKMAEVAARGETYGQCAEKPDD